MLHLLKEHRIRAISDVVKSRLAECMLEVNSLKGTLPHRIEPAAGTPFPLGKYGSYLYSGGGMVSLFQTLAVERNEVNRRNHQRWKARIPAYIGDDRASKRK